MRLSEETRHKVLRAAAEMNYRPNLMPRTLRTVVSRLIAIISDTLGGMQAACSETTSIIDDFPPHEWSRTLRGHSVV